MPSWLTIIGIGEDGTHGLSEAACEALKNAEYIYGGERHLKMVREKLHGEQRLWPKPFLNAIDEIKALRNKKVVVLASGDPLFHGVGNSLIEHFSPQEINIYYQPSSFNLALQRLGWAKSNVECISLVGKSINTLKKHIQNKQKLIILPPNAQAFFEILSIFEAQKAHQTKFTILEFLGGEREKISPELSIIEARNYRMGDLYIIAADCRGADILAHPLGTILPDSYFHNDGQLTKHNIRAVVLSLLSPHNYQLLWDIGAGSGSISIEWLRAAPKARAFAIEKDKLRAERIYENANNIGVTGLSIYNNDAEDIIKDLEKPDAIFIGGGFTDGEIASKCWKALKIGGRFVANGVTLETEAAFQKWVKKHGGELIKLSISNAKPLGNFHVWRQALPVTILVATKKE